MSKQVSKGDLLVEKRFNTDTVYEAVEDAPPYPVTAVAKTIHQDRVEIPEAALDEYIIGNRKNVFEHACEVMGVAHSDPRCDAGIIITKAEMAAAVADVGVDITKDVATDMILGDLGPKTAADILLTLCEAYVGRNHNAEKWFDNVRLTDLDTAYCRECDHIITDGLKR